MAVLPYPSPQDENRVINENIETLRLAWLDAITSVAPHLGGLADALSQRLAENCRRGRTGEAQLLQIVDGAMQRAQSACAPNVAGTLDRRLRRAVYEYLLVVDAAGPDERPYLTFEEPPPPVAPEIGRIDPRFRREPTLYVAGDEVAEAAQFPEEPVSEAPGPAPVPGRFPMLPPEPSTAPPDRPATPRHMAPPAAPPAPAPATPVAEAPHAPPAAPTPPAMAASQPRPGGGGGAGWNVRERTPSGRVQAERTGVAFADVQRKITEWIGRKKFAQAAAVIQQLCQDVGGRDAARMAVETGDLCLERDRRMAATSCFIAALRADPVSETALARLAELCVEDEQTDLAVAHLERLAQLARLRGDNEATIRALQQVATLAPHRDDVIALLVQAQAAARHDQ